MDDANGYNGPLFRWHAPTDPFTLLAVSYPNYQFIIQQQPQGFACNKVPTVRSKLASFWNAVWSNETIWLLQNCFFFRFEQTQSAVLFRLIYVVWRMNSKLALNIQKNFQNASTTFHSVTFISVGSVFEVILKMFCSRLVLVRQHCIHKFLAERCVA